MYLYRHAICCIAGEPHARLQNDQWVYFGVSSTILLMVCVTSSCSSRIFLNPPASRVSNSYDQPQLPPTKMATAENGETKQSRISGKPERALCPYDTDMSVSYHTMYFSYDHVF